MNAEKIQFSVEFPLKGLEIDNNLKLLDVHVHIWNSWYFKEFLDTCQKFNITDMIGITSLKVKDKLEKKNLDMNITFCNFLSGSDFKKYKSDKLIKQVNKAKEHNFKLLKMFFGPRLWTLSRRKSYYRINDQRLFPVYSKIENEGMPVIIHVADPDIWYEKKYQNVNKYGTKEDRIADFIDLLEKFPNITWISAHFGCLPENLPKLGEMFELYPNLYVDTGSTKWMVRELGKNVEKSRKWIIKYQDRIVWGSDIANMTNLSMALKKKNRDFYWKSRFWSHRLFWETSKHAALAFNDSDNPEGTFINGLHLPKEVLKKIYYTNAKNLIDNS